MGLGNRINEIRKEKKMSIDELCELSGVPKGTLSKITAGITANPTLDTVQAIAKALGCRLDDFDDPPTEQKEKAPVLQESPEETEARAIMLYQALINAGWIKEGQDITKQQLEVLDGISIILSSLFD